MRPQKRRKVLGRRICGFTWMMTFFVVTTYRPLRRPALATGLSRMERRDWEGGRNGRTGVGMGGGRGGGGCGRKTWAGELLRVAGEASYCSIEGRLRKGEEGGGKRWLQWKKEPSYGAGRSNTRPLIRFPHYVPIHLLAYLPPSQPTRRPHCLPACLPTAVSLLSLPLTW